MVTSANIINSFEDHFLFHFKDSKHNNNKGIHKTNISLSYELKTATLKARSHWGNIYNFKKRISSWLIFILIQINSLKYTHARTEGAIFSWTLLKGQNIAHYERTQNIFKSMLVNICLSLTLIKREVMLRNTLRKTGSQGMDIVIVCY